MVFAEGRTADCYGPETAFSTPARTFATGILFTDFICSSKVSIQTREYHKAWRDRNKDKIHKYYLRDYAKRRDAIQKKRSAESYRARLRAYSKKYRELKKEEIKIAMKDWSIRNQDRIRKYRKGYAPRRRALYLRNRLAILKGIKLRSHRYVERVRRYRFNRRRKDIQYCLAERLRATMRRALSRQFVRKSRRTFDLIGCTPEELKAHLQSQFLDGMDWGNRHLWHIDHIRPLSSFDLRDLKEQLKAFHYSNLQPLWAEDNHRKSDTTPPRSPKHHRRSRGGGAPRSLG